MLKYFQNLFFPDSDSIACSPLTSALLFDDHLTELKDNLNRFNLINIYDISFNNGYMHFKGELGCYIAFPRVVGELFLFSIYYPDNSFAVLMCSHDDYIITDCIPLIATDLFYYG